jgi:hypothetical protein
LDGLLASVTAGRSRALVLRGEAGVGKTALLEYLLQAASRCRIARTVGVESEMELAFAGLHLLCAPMLDHIDSLPGPQREALAIAFGLSTGDPPDRFLVGLAVLQERTGVAVAQAADHEGSSAPTPGRWPAGSNRASCDASGRFPIRRNGCCSRRRPSRWVTCPC